MVDWDLPINHPMITATMSRVFDEMVSMMALEAGMKNPVTMRAHLIRRQ
jgi:hypothetical protein